MFRSSATAVLTAPGGGTTASSPSFALEQAADLAVLAPSVHNTQPWIIELQADRLLLRADRSRQLGVQDPAGRALVQSVGAALLNARVALAAEGWAVQVSRLPDPEQPDLLAVVRPLPGVPDAALAALAAAVLRRRTNRRSFDAADPVPDGTLRRLAAAAEAEGTVLVPVLTEEHRRLVARVTQQADAMQNADPAYRADLRHWTTRTPEQGDGIPPSVVPRVAGPRRDDLPIRDFDTTGEAALPGDTHSGVDQTLVLLASQTDDEYGWLRAGEALQRVLLELTLAGWAASPFTQPIEVPLTRTQLRAALTWDAHPQMLLRVGHAGLAPRTPRRPRSEVVVGSRRAPNHVSLRP